MSTELAYLPEKTMHRCQILVATRLQFISIWVFEPHELGGNELC